MKDYIYQNDLVSKKQLKQLLSWSFTKYGSIKACLLADQLKYLGFKYATQAGISISIEDLKVPRIKNSILNNANQEILKAEKIKAKGKITDVEKFQKTIDTWNIASESLKDELVTYFKKYDPLNSVYIMAFSGARGNLSQVRQLVGMRGLMSDPNGQIMNLPIKKNFREGLTITDYLMSGYGARKGIVDTALKTANSGYLTRRLIDVAQDIIIREKDCLTNHSFLFLNNQISNHDDTKVYNKVFGRLLNKPVYDLKTNELIAETNTHITLNLIKLFKSRNIKKFYIRSPLTCSLYRSICQKCYGWNLANEHLVDMGEAVGIIAGQSIGEPGTQLTMRTFHTGGIFTSETGKQLISPINGIIEFSSVLKIVKLRTNRGENVLLTESSGSLVIRAINQNTKNIQLELPRNTILFIENNQIVNKNFIIGQLSGNIKQTKIETKYIVSEASGEIFIPQLKNETNLTTRNKLLWVLSGQVYQSPLNAFLNFYQDYKINKNSYIFRSKITIKKNGWIKKIENDKKLSEQIIEICNTSNVLQNSILYQLSNSINNKNYILKHDSKQYLINLKVNNNKLSIPSLSTQHFATLITNKFIPLTGGISYYNTKLYRKNLLYPIQSIYFINNIQRVSYPTLIWCGEEKYNLTESNNLVKIKNETFIPKDSQITEKIVSKTSGFFSFEKKNNVIQNISIKTGTLYKIKNLKQVKLLNQQVFYPGEILLDHIHILQPSLCAIIKIQGSYEMLLRPLNVYEIPTIKGSNFIFCKTQNDAICEVGNRYKYSTNSGKLIQEEKIGPLVINFADLNLINSTKKKTNIYIEIINNKKKTNLKLNVREQLLLNDYIPTYLKYTPIEPCLTIKHRQYINSWSNIGYLEIITNKTLELVKLKLKQQFTKQIFLISNTDCIKISKTKITNPIVNDLLIDNRNIDQIGRILINNSQFLTLQKGRPYFFPNCKTDNFGDETNFKYRFIASQISNIKSRYKKNRNVHYLDIKTGLPNYKIIQNSFEKIEFPRIFIKKHSKCYTSGVPIFVREFLINKKNKFSSKLSNLDYRPWFGYLDHKDKIYRTKKQYLLPSLDRIRLDNVFVMFMKNSQLTENESKKCNKFNYELASVSLLEHPFRTIGIHSITEDYLEQENNNVYGKNGEFIEKGQIIGLINFEKEITGDIVQGLPRIEELLEARKKKRLSKHSAKINKKGLLIRKTNIDPNFEFRKLGNQIKENEKINPHNLIKIYFNYYAKIKYFDFEKRPKVKLCRLANNYEASYRSFKKVQLLILNSVQSVYCSQGVTIADKHLEVIIKQMTTKVLITHEGDTPLLPREVIDLYHIKYINQIVELKHKKLAFYVPLLLGITKASLNNPSFISAASFQETTKVLTKAAIEGRLDWLRGLKENIIIGHLIPAGTGSKTCTNSFKKNFKINKSMKKLLEFTTKS